MSAYGIAGLVDGFFKGREIRHGWEDRKDAKKRQEKMDGFYEAEQGRVAERHGWARDQYGRSVSDYERGRADDDAARKAYQDAIDATEASLADGQQPADVTTSTMGAPPPPGPTEQAASNLPAAIDATTRRSAAADQFDRYFDPNDLGAAPRVADGAQAGPRRADPTPQDTRGPAIQEMRDNVASAPPRTIEDMRAQAIAEARASQDMGAPQPAGTQAVPPMNMPDNPRLLTEGPGPGGGGMTQLYDQGILPRRYVGDPPARQERAEQAADPEREAIMDRFRGDLEDRIARDQPNYNHEWGKGGLVPDAREAANRAGAALGAIPRTAGGVIRDAADTATVINNGLNRAVNPIVKYATGGEDGYEFPMAPVRGRAPSAPPAAPTASTPAPATAPASPASAPPPAATGPRISNVPASAPAATKQLAAVADQAMGEASTPAVQAAAAAVARDEPALGAPGNRPYSEKQRQKASKAFVDRYLEVGAPIVIKEYLRTGQIDKAMKFQEFLDTKATKKGIEHWSRAAFAATVGDFETFADEIIEGQNVAGYFGDTVKIDKSKSGFTKDDEGNIIGAKLIMVDEKTGTSFEQVFDSPADLVNAGMYFASPEVQFEMAQKQVEAARETALGAAKAGAESQEKMAKLILEQTNKIIENSKGLDGVPTKTQEQAEMEAEDVVRRLFSGAPRRAEADPLAEEGAAPPGPPVLRRP